MRVSNQEAQRHKVRECNNTLFVKNNRKIVRTS